jgi:metal-responsive CopG/Arc/MetJ family transcriptional regulator
MKTARSIPFDKILQVRAPEALTDALDVAASRRMVSRSDYVRVALLDHLKADGIEPVQTGAA